MKRKNDESAAGAAAGVKDQALSKGRARAPVVNYVDSSDSSEDERKPPKREKSKRQLARDESSDETSDSDGVGVPQRGPRKLPPREPKPSDSSESSEDEGPSHAQKKAPSKNSKSVKRNGRAESSGESESEDEEPSKKSKKASSSKPQQAKKNGRAKDNEASGSDEEGSKKPKKPSSSKPKPPAKNRGRVDDSDAELTDLESESDEEGPSNRPPRAAHKPSVPVRRSGRAQKKTEQSDLTLKPKPAKIARLDDTATEPLDVPIDWYTHSSLNSNKFADLVKLTDDQKAQLKEVVSSTRVDGLSERISYAPDLHYKAAQGYLAACLSAEKLQEQREVPELPAQRRDPQRKKFIPESKSKKKIPHLLYTTGFKEGVIGADGRSIVDTASCIDDALGQGANTVYNSENFRIVPSKIGKGRPGTTFFEDRGFPPAEEGDVGVVLPVVELDVKDPELEDKATTLSSCLIKGCNELIDVDAFSIEKLQKLSKGVQGTVLRQRPQHSSRNLKLKGQTMETFEAQGYKELRSVVQALDNHQKVVDKARDGYINCTASFPIQESALQTMQRDLKAAQLLERKDLRKVTYPVISFASNIDVGDAKEQMKSIEKLPEFTRPNQRLMKLLKEKIPGINQVQVYVKGPGCRTVAHFENQGIGSINVNIGDDDCVWFCIPMKFAAALEKLMCDQNIWPYHTEIWPKEEELKKAGISYQKFIQKKGEMVMVNTGTYHWVQSNGFCTNISWNILLNDPSQIAAAALFNDHNASHRYNSVLPLEKLLWTVAKEKLNPGTEFSALVKRLLICSLAHSKFEMEYFTEKLWEVHNQEECPISFANISNCANPKCKRNSLFNLKFVKTIGKDEQKSFCGNCIEGWRLAEFTDQKRNTKIYQLHTMDELIKIFDEYN